MNLDKEYLQEQIKELLNRKVQLVESAKLVEGAIQQTQFLLNQIVDEEEKENKKTTTRKKKSK